MKKWALWGVIVSLFVLLTALFYWNKEEKISVWDVYGDNSKVCIKWEETDLCIEKEWNKRLNKAFQPEEMWKNRSYEYEKISDKNSYIIEKFDIMYTMNAKYHIYDWKVIKTEFFNESWEAEITFNKVLDWYVTFEEFKEKKYFWIQEFTYKKNLKLIEVDDEKIKNYNWYYFKVENIYFPVYMNNTERKSFYKKRKSSYTEWDWWEQLNEGYFRDFQLNFDWWYPYFMWETVNWGRYIEKKRVWDIEESKEYFDIKYFYDEEFDKYSFLVFWKEGLPLQTYCNCWGRSWPDYNYVNKK